MRFNLGMGSAAVAAVSVALAALLLLSGFFSAAETAYTGFSRAKMKCLAKSDKRAALVIKMTGDFGNVLTSLLIGNNIVNIAATTLAAVLFTAVFGDIGATLSTVVMTALVLVFGEVTPKTIANERPEGFAVRSAGMVYVCTVIFRPFCRLFALWRRLVCRICGLKSKKHVVTEDELRIIVSDAADDGALPRSEEELIERAILYGGRKVGECMTRAGELVYAEIGESPEAIARIFEGSGHRTIPITCGGLQRVCGVLDEAEFFRFLSSGGRDIGGIVRPVMRCRPTDGLAEVFGRMQAAKVRVAMVFDGARAVGIITERDIACALLLG